MLLRGSLLHCCSVHIYIVRCTFGQLEAHSKPPPLADTCSRRFVAIARCSGIQFLHRIQQTCLMLVHVGWLGSSSSPIGIRRPSSQSVG